MKTNKFMRIASFLLVAVVLTTCAISGTFAKYTSTTTGSDSARVAKWAFDIGDNKNLTNTFSFNLFDTIKDTIGNIDDTDVDTNGKNDNEVVIAPGTQGEFSFTITNNSEVNATYAINYSATKNGIPVKFSVDNGANWTDDLADVAATAIGMNGGTTTIRVMWKWDFETNGSDDADTALGIDGTKAITVEAVVTVTQVD